MIYSGAIYSRFMVKYKDVRGMTLDRVNFLTPANNQSCKFCKERNKA